MNKSTDSDLTMLAKNNFESVLSSVRNSCLNYSIHVSPFSATISLKKTIVKDRNGDCVIPPLICEDKSSDLRDDKAALEDEICSLRIKYKELLSAYASSNDNITSLQNSIIDRDNIISDLNADKRADQKATENLQKELRLYQARFQDEISYDNREMIMWKLDLDRVMTNHKILEDKYRNLSEKCKCTCGSPQTVPQSELVSLKHPSCKSLQEDPSDSTRIQDDEFSCYAEGYCGKSDLALCKNLEEEDPMANSEVEEITVSFVSHCITASESTYPSFSFIVSLVPHCVRLLDSGKLPLANVTKWRTLEARYQEERETCKQS